MTRGKRLTVGEDFTDDLLVWVFFYGPDGGEVSR